MICCPIKCGECGFVALLDLSAASARASASTCLVCREGRSLAGLWNVCQEPSELALERSVAAWRSLSVLPAPRGLPLTAGTGVSQWRCAPSGLQPPQDLHAVEAHIPVSGALEQKEPDPALCLEVKSCSVLRCWAWERLLLWGISYSFILSWGVRG